MRQQTTAIPVIHPLAPVFNAESRVLLLGTMPSPKSREIGFYYGHPQNRFWRVLAALWFEPIPESIADRKAFVLRHRIALWDVVASCTIIGASDASIRNVVSNDIADLLGKTSIQTIFTTGKKAGKLYQTFCFPETGRPAIILPSPSPANCRMSLEELIETYRCVREACEK